MFFVCVRVRACVYVCACVVFSVIPTAVLSLLEGRDSDGFLQNQEKFIRECIRKFPYCEAALLQQLMKSIAPVEIVSQPLATSTLWCSG